MGYPCVERSIQALPWKGQFYNTNPDEMINEEEIRKAVADSINQGIPVEYGSEEDGVIIGYQNNAKEWICIHPFDERGDVGEKDENQITRN